MATVYANTDERMAHLKKVKAEVVAEADQIESKAEAALAPHRKTGETHIELGVGDTDATVTLVGPDALAFEFGHENVQTGGYTAGAYVLTDAAGILEGLSRKPSRSGGKKRRRRGRTR